MCECIACHIVNNVKCISSLMRFISHVLCTWFTALDLNFGCWTLQITLIDFYLSLLYWCRRFQINLSLHNCYTVCISEVWSENKYTKHGFPLIVLTRCDINHKIPTIKYQKSRLFKHEVFTVNRRLTDLGIYCFIHIWSFSLSLSILLSRRWTQRTWRSLGFLQMARLCSLHWGLSINLRDPL